MAASSTALTSSFRDPAGFIYEEEGILHRYIAPHYAKGYRRLMDSGLYALLVEKGQLVSHTESQHGSDGSIVLVPERLPFISYPYEWCFGQQKAAALLTLSLLRSALEHGLILQDASAFNVAFRGAQAIFFDTLSFVPYEENTPWKAYRQFCEMFLAPLALMAYADVRLRVLQRVYIDGIPLDLAARLLPMSAHLNLGLSVHLFMHAKAQSSNTTGNGGSVGIMQKTALFGLIDNLEQTVNGLTYEPASTAWGDYYSDTNYTDTALNAKEELVAAMLAEIRPAPKMVWDLGANNGRFSRLASAMGAFTVAWDVDAAAVEKGWRETVRRGDTNLLPLLQDFTNPSPSLGWHHAERNSLLERASADAVLALALVHHLTLGHNLPLNRIVDFFADCGQWLIVEFVPQDDSQSQRLLAGKGNIFPNYTQANFDRAVLHRFAIVRTVAIRDTKRTLYLCRRLKANAFDEMALPLR